MSLPLPTPPRHLFSSVKVPHSHQTKSYQSLDSLGSTDTSTAVRPPEADMLDLKIICLYFQTLLMIKYFPPMYSRPDLIYHLTIVMKDNSLGRFLYRNVMPHFSKNQTHCAQGIPLKGSRNEGQARVLLCGHRRAVLSSARLKGLPWPRGQGHTSSQPSDIETYFKDIVRCRVIITTVSHSSQDHNSVQMLFHSKGNLTHIDPDCIQ